MKKILKASAYYLEDVLGMNLNQRANDGKLSFILLNQPPICNQRCRRCFVPPHRLNYFQKHSENLLHIKEYQKILADAGKNGIKCLEISGEGEPFLSKNLFPIIELAYNNNLMTTLITNGQEMLKEQIKFLKEKNVTLIFSRGTMNKEDYDSDTQTCGSFDNQSKNIEMASEIYKGTKTIENNFEIYRIAIHTTEQKDNLEQIPKIKEYCQKKEIFFSVAPVAEVGCACEHPEIIPKRRERLLEVIVNKGDNSIIHSHSSKKVFGREVCGTALYGLNIGWDGAILFDAHYGYEVGEQNLLGNIKNISFKEAVKNQRKYMKTLFENIDGSCPVRDPKGKKFLEEVIKKR